MNTSCRLRRAASSGSSSVASTPVQAHRDGTGRAKRRGAADDHPVEGRRALDQQQADLNALRDRAGNLFQFGALAAAFIGGLALRRNANVSAWTSAGAVAFSVLACLLVYVLRPRNFTFSNDATIMLGPEWDLDPGEVAEHLARYLMQHKRENSAVISRMMKAYTVGMVVLLAEIACLLIDVLER